MFPASSLFDHHQPGPPTLLLSGHDSCSSLKIIRSASLVIPNGNGAIAIHAYTINFSSVCLCLDSVHFHSCDHSFNVDSSPISVSCCFRHVHKMIHKSRQWHCMYTYLANGNTHIYEYNKGYYFPPFLVQHSLIADTPMSA
jgi:hypothetical protein